MDSGNFPPQGLDILGICSFIAPVYIPEVSSTKSKVYIYVISPKDLHTVFEASRAKGIEAGSTEPVLGSMCKKFVVLLPVLASVSHSKTVAGFTSTREIHFHDIDESGFLKYKFFALFDTSIPFLECCQFIF